MTEGAQQALRRTMEIYSKTTRFALACNTSDKIIGTSLISTVPSVIVCKLCRLSSSSEAIQLRYAVIRYSKLTDAQILTRLLEVSDREKVPRTDDGLEAIVFTAQGDMRQVSSTSILVPSPLPLYLLCLVQRSSMQLRKWRWSGCGDKAP